MTIEEIRALLGWCTLVNSGLLLVWWGFFVFARGFVYRVHTAWFRLSEETFDAIHYAGMALLKVAIIMFNLTPYLALWLI